METHKSQYSITYVGSKMTTLDKACGTKWGAIGNVLKEPIWNLGNMLRTHWEQKNPTAWANVRGMNCEEIVQVAMHYWKVSKWVLIIACWCEGWSSHDSHV